MKYRVITVILLLSLLLIVAGCGDSSELGDTGDSVGLLILHNGTVIPATGAEPIADGIVIIEGSHIQFVGAEADFDVPSGAQEFDADGMTILPGFIDAHVHSTSSPALRRSFLEEGITSVCDQGTPLDSIGSFEQDDYGEIPAARVFLAGPIITAPGGLPDAVLNTDLNYEVGTPQEGRAAVEDLHGLGVEQIKVYLQQESNGVSYPMLDEATLGAIVDAAHTFGLPVRAHVTYVSLLEMAVTAGVDSIEHVPIHATEAENQAISEEALMQFIESSDPLQLLFDHVYPEYESLLQQMVADGIYLVPTLDRPFGQTFRKSDQTPIERASVSALLGIVGRFNDMGGNVALGTDYNISVGLPAGMPIGELEMLQAAGLTPMELIEAGTHHAATACGQGDQLGTLEPGKLADVIVVDGDPLEDFMTLSRVILVVKDGEIAFTAEDAFGPP